MSTSRARHPKLVVTERESTGPMDTPWGIQLQRIEDKIGAGEQAGILARWESGRALLRRRDGDKLPKGLLSEVSRALDVRPRELQYRMCLADAVRTEDELRALVAQFPTWKAIVTKALPKEPKVEKQPEHEHAKAVRSLVRSGNSTLEYFDASVLTPDDIAALAKLARRILTFTDGI